MKLCRAASCALAVLLFCSISVQAQVGEVTFPNSGSVEAQDAFLRGVALLHNFEYASAIEAFRAAQEIDPDFAMAFWGEAMAYNHPIWLEQDSIAARAALGRLGASREERSARAETDRERAFLNAVEVLYGDGAKEDRDFAYADAMRDLHEAFPDDPEAATFYALAILGTAHSGRDVSTYMRAAAIVDEVFDDHPNHPGAAHYLIHSYDDPEHAPLGLDAARAYSVIAPDAAHAQHMTSHIFVAMGMWDDVVVANENARRVVHAAVAARGGEPRGCGHYNFWLEYGYLQQDRGEDARALLRECFETAREFDGRRGSDMLDPDNTTRGSYAGMLARYILDTERWDDEALGWTLPLDDAFPARLTWTFVNGYAAAMRGELTTTEVSREALSEAANDLDDYLNGTPSGGDANLANAFQTRARVLGMELDALIAEASGDRDAAIAIATEAADAEAGLPAFFGPPMIDKPARELLGELLLRADRPGDAADAFRKQLERTPERALSLRGLELARRVVANRPDADADLRAVLGVVQALFDMIAGEIAQDPSILTEGVTFVATARTADGIQITERGRDNFFEQISGRGTNLLERMWEPTVTVHGAIATVWTPYDFHIDGQFSHCGIDAFSLVKTNEGWKIASIVWTIEPTGCADSPLGRPGGGR